MRNLFKFFFFSLPVILVSSAEGQMFWNQAASLAGNASSYIVVGHSADLNITGSFTIECWVNASNVINPLPIQLVSKGIASSFSGYDVLLDSGRVRIRINGNTRFVSTSATRVLPGSWTHVAATYDVGTNTFATYINGLSVGTAVVAGAAPVANTDTLFIGKGFNSPFEGLIDDVRVWNRVLTAPEIRKWMRTELGASTGVYNGLVLSLIFQSSINQTFFNMFDFSGHGNSGSNRGATAVAYNSRPYTYTTMNDCVLLDGTGDYLAGASTAQLEITGSFTTECWVYPTNSLVPSFQMLVSKRGPGSTGYEMYLNLGRVTVRTNGSTRLIGLTVLPSGYWSHVAATFNSTTNLFSVYVNGILDGTVTAAAAPTLATDSLFIGHGLNSDFAGYIDEVRIFPTARTQQEIQSYMYRSIEFSNAPSNVTGYNLDGIAYANTNLTGTPLLQFMGDAAFAAVSTQSNRPLSPLNRADAQNFPQGFYLKSSDRRIPQTGTSGPMIPDTLAVSQSVVISDLNFYLASNHTFDSDMEVTLVAPTGDSVNVCFDFSMLDANDNIVTLFDDNADSSLVNNVYTSASPRIRPQNSLNAAFAGRNAQGLWRLKINDDAAGDTGRVYFWGIQINNQTLVGVQEVAGLTPQQFSLDQNYPNPFNPTTTIQFSVPVQSLVTVKIYDILGREVRTLVNEAKTPGTYKVLFDGNGLASGTYFYRMKSGNFIETKKLLLLK